MNKLLFFLLCALPLSLYAQGEYAGFASEGKTWLIYHCPMWGDQYIYKMYIESDTVIGNNTCKKLFSIKNNETPKYVGALREDLYKVYFCGSNQADVCLYDFGLKIGDTFANHMKVVAKEQISYEDNNLTTLSLRYEDELEVKWIENIGSLSRPDCNVIYPGNSECLVACIESGDTIFLDKEMYNRACSLNEKFADESSNQAEIYDISGRPVIQPSHGLYIIRGRNGDGRVVTRKLLKR